MNEIKKYLKNFISGTKTMFKEFFNRKTNKKQRANMWSFTRLLSSIINIIPIIIGITTGSIIPYIFGLCIAGYGALTDYLDGKSARKHKSYSEYGKALDQVADKAYALTNGILISIINPLYLIPISLEGIIGLVNYPVATKYNYFSKDSLQIGRIKEWPLMISLALGYISTINPITYFISLGIISITIPLQIKTAFDYHQRNKIQKKIYQIDDTKLIYKQNKQLNVIDKKKLVKEINLNNNVSEINEIKHRRELLVGLKLLKEELINPFNDKSNIKVYKKTFK